MFAVRQHCQAFRRRREIADGTVTGYLGLPVERRGNNAENRAAVSLPSRDGQERPYDCHSPSATGEETTDECSRSDKCDCSVAVDR